jgi:hypothetical protein
MIQLWSGNYPHLLFELGEMTVRLVPGSGRDVRVKLIQQNLGLLKVLPQLIFCTAQPGL